MDGSARPRGRSFDEGVFRDVVLTRADAEAIVAALRPKFPRTFLVQPRLTFYERLKPPLVLNSLDEVEGFYAHVYFVDEQWTAELIPDGKSWDFYFQPLAQLDLRWSEPKRRFLSRTLKVPSPPYIPRDFLYVGFRSGEERFRGRILRTIESYCEAVRVQWRWPALTPHRWPKGAIWIGKDAVRWCCDEPGRVLGLEDLPPGTFVLLPAEIAPPMSSCEKEESREEEEKKMQSEGDGPKDKD